MFHCLLGIVFSPSKRGGSDAKPWIVVTIKQTLVPKQGLFNHGDDPNPIICCGPSNMVHVHFTLSSRAHQLQKNDFSIFHNTVWPLGDFQKPFRFSHGHGSLSLCKAALTLTKIYAMFDTGPKKLNGSCDNCNGQ